MSMAFGNLPAQPPVPQGFQMPRPGQQAAPVTPAQQARMDFVNPQMSSQQIHPMSHGGAMTPYQSFFMPLPAQAQARGIMTMQSQPMPYRNTTGASTPVNMQALTNSLMAGQRH